MERWFDTSLPSSSAGMSPVQLVLDILLTSAVAGSPEPYSPLIRGRDYQVGANIIVDLLKVHQLLMRVWYRTPTVFGTIRGPFGGAQGRGKSLWAPATLNTARS